MRKSLFLIFSLILSGVTAFSANGLRIMEGLVMHSRILNQDVRFSVCLPVNYYETKQSFPVVYLLHGLGDDESSWLEYGRISQFADQAVAEKAIIPMIFIMPQGYRDYYVNDYKGTFLYQDMFVKELIPYIDSMFRTLPEKDERAVMGYSMGGFGAIILPLMHPELFGVSVPLSISVRTDKQYMTEEASGWDDQWGRLFGEPGFKDNARLTSYYKQNSPFHLLEKMQPDDLKGLRIFINNGDKEQTLCRSNEELHILMRSRNIPHEFRVRSGGHSWDYWCSALPDALRFISDAFESKPYRGDITFHTDFEPVNENQLRNFDSGKNKLTVFVPSEYDQTNRRYPVLYLNGVFSASQKKSIASLVNSEIERNIISPMIVVFLPLLDSATIKNSIPMLEDKIRIRHGYRFQAIAGFEKGATAAFELGSSTGLFGMCILSDGFMEKDKIPALISAINKADSYRTTFFIDAPDKGGYYESNGEAHMELRDKDIQHEYRVREGNGGFGWFVSGFPEILEFTAKRFHK
jgi:enterochelin esterase-like enzyme